ncbi:MAG TPA: hypothetical protein DF282_03915 [Hyphomonas sp.]|nr:hypothetical protein [Hyphomonas sp.]
MNTEHFIQQGQHAKTTLSELRRIRSMVQATEALSLFAYATQSGLAAFDLEFGPDFWEGTTTRWLFGIDYGRTQPQAIRALCEKPNSTVRIHDGAWVAQQSGFLPRQDFHLKTSFLRCADLGKLGVVTGSGNFSSNGLRRSVEAGTSIFIDSMVGDVKIVEDGWNTANEFWGSATPAEQILDDYEDKWRNSFSRSAQNQTEEVAIPGPREIFWIETGYVTRNRGLDKPGNQIDLPRGMSRYFGMNPSQDLALNSTIGSINFMTPTNGPVERNLRLGNNSMEKITLPIPETHGFDIYDGKVLVFRKMRNYYVLNALEAADFEATFGDRLSVVMIMGSGRRYGHID